MDIETGTRSANGRRFEISERLFKTPDGRVVQEGDPEANSLFKRAGQSIPMQEAIALGLVEKEEPVKDKPAQTKQAAKPADKQKKVQPKNKAKGGK